MGIFDGFPIPPDKEVSLIHSSSGPKSLSLIPVPVSEYLLDTKTSTN